MPATALWYPRPFPLAPVAAVLVLATLTLAIRLGTDPIGPAERQSRLVSVPLRPFSDPSKGTVAALDTAPREAPRRLVVGYVPMWARRDGYPVRQIDFSIVNVVAHFALVPRADGSLRIPEQWGPFPDPDLVSRAHTFDAKAVLVIGGDDEDAARAFSSLAASHEYRSRFITSILVLLQRHGYDGVDIDWEFPLDATDRENFTTLLRELRMALPKSATLSIAAPANDWYGRWLDVAAIAPLVDWIGAMTYTLSAPGWSAEADHNSPLFGPLSLDSTRSYYLARGLTPAKLLLGIAFFGVRFDGATGLGEPLTSSRGSFLTYGDAQQLVGAGWTAYRDTVARVPYLAGPGGRGIVSFDDPWSVARKCDYVRERDVAGVIIWHLGQDRADASQPLLTAAASCTRSGPPPAFAPSLRLRQ